MKLSRRFDARAYLSQLDAMDSHDVRGAIGQVRAKALVVDVDSDQLSTGAQAKWLGEHLPHVRRFTIHSAHGHDAFLIEWAQLAPLLTQALTLS